MGSTPNPTPAIERAPDNTWWAVSGTYADGREFAGAVAFVSLDPEGKPLVDVVLRPDWRDPAVQSGERVDLENITSSDHMVLIDGAVPGRLANTSAELLATQQRLAEVLGALDAIRFACSNADRSAQEKVEQIAGLLPPAE